MGHKLIPISWQCDHGCRAGSLLEIFVEKSERSSLRVSLFPGTKGGSTQKKKKGTNRA